MARPRDPRLDVRILDAALELLVECGFGALSIEQVAARAGVGKPAVYRRFRDKAALVVAAIERALPAMPAAPPDAGADGPADDRVRSRLRELMEQASPADPERYAALLGTLMVERTRHPELIETYRERVLRPRRAVVRAAVEDGQRLGVLRGEVDPEHAVDLLGGVFLARTHAGLDVGPAHRDRLFALWWAAMRAER